MRRLFNSAALLLGACSLLAAGFYTVSPVPKNWCDMQVRDNNGTWETQCQTTSCTIPMDCGKGSDTTMMSGWTVWYCTCDFGSPYYFICGTNAVPCRTMLAIGSGGSKKIVCYDCHCGPSQGLEETQDDYSGQGTSPGSSFATMCTCTTPPQ